MDGSINVEFRKKSIIDIKITKQSEIDWKTCRVINPAEVCKKTIEHTDLGLNPRRSQHISAIQKLIAWIHAITGEDSRGNLKNQALVRAWEK